MGNAFLIFVIGGLAGERASNQSGRLTDGLLARLSGDAMARLPGRRHHIGPSVGPALRRRRRRQANEQRQLARETTIHTVVTGTHPLSQTHTRTLTAEPLPAERTSV